MSFSKRFDKLLSELVDLVGADDVGEVEVERRFFGGWKIRVSKSGENAPAFVSLGGSAAAQPASAASPTEDTADASSDNLHKVSSPMVGMFYRSSSPEAKPFVEVGDTVTAGQTLCIIEAMKIMNEIESDASGRVASALVENGSPVEYNTTLFLIEPI